MGLNMNSHANINFLRPSFRSKAYQSWLTQCARKKVGSLNEEVLFSEIEKHKWLLSEKLNRDVGMEVAALDYFENETTQETNDPGPTGPLAIPGLSAKRIEGSVWDTIADSQPPKQIVNKRIIMPLMHPVVARKHAVVPPRAIIFFGPPGTGKTHFVKAIAGALKWWFIEVSPSTLMADGENCLGANLKNLMEQGRDLEKAVLFIDEFEELAGSRDNASRIEKSITNEFLKQIPLFKEQPHENLLVCATNYIHQLDTALLRPGRFDCVIPVGGLDDQSRRQVFEHFLADTNRSGIDVDRIISEIPMFTPAEIEYLFQKVRQEAFEQECVLGEDFKVSTDMFLEVIPTIRQTLDSKTIEAFQRDSAEFTRY